MNVRRCLPLTLLVLAACGNSTGGLGTADGKYRVVAQCSTDQLEDALAQHTDATLVIGLDGDWRRVYRIVAGAGRKPAPFVVATGPAPTDDEPICDAIITRDSGARTALELAHLGARGVDLPNSKVEVGVTVTTPANRDAGGTRRVAPGDAFVAMMRAQHGRLLGPQPDGSRVTIGVLAADGASPALLAEVRAQAAEPSARTLIEPRDGETPTDFAARVAASKPAALLVVGNPASLPAGATDGLPLVVLDEHIDETLAACRVACLPTAIGRAIADEVRHLLPTGGALLLVSANATELRAAFASALGLEEPR